MKLSQVRKLALALDAVTEEPHHDDSSFRVRGKIFVTVPPQGEHLHVFVPGEKQDEAVALHPSFIEKLFWGSKALGVRIHLPQASPTVVRALVLAACDARVAKDAGPKRKATGPKSS